MSETFNSQPYWPSRAYEYLEHISPETQHTIQEVCSIDWKTSTEEGEWLGHVYATLSPDLFLEGRYRITPMNTTYKVVFEYSDPSIAAEGVYHNDDPFACQELCREDLLVRLAKLSLGVLKANKREIESVQNKTRKEMRNVVHSQITFL